jgi:hypothetical protein
MYTPETPVFQATEQQAIDASPSLWRQTTVLPIGAGEHEAFSIGPDQSVWAYRLATREHSAGRLECTQLPAEHFACTRLQDRRVLLASVSQQELYWTVEGKNPERWSAPRRCGYQRLDGLHSMEQVHLLQLGFEVLLGVLARRSKVLGKISAQLATEDSYQFWVGRWTGSGFEFGRKPVSLRGDDALGNAFIFGKPEAFETATPV